LNEIAYPLVGFLHQHRARIGVGLPGGCRRFKPLPIGVPVEVVTWPDRTIDVRVLHARVLINRCGGCLAQGDNESTDSDQRGRAKKSHEYPFKETPMKTSGRQSGSLALQSTITSPAIGTIP
jgi:hypothetical protein